MSVGLPDRVLMTTDAVGGVWQYGLDLARGLAEAGVGIEFAVLGPAPSPAQSAEAAAVPGLRLVATGLPLDWTTGDEAKVAGASEALAALAAEAGAALVHLNHPGLGVARWPAPLLCVVHSCHGSWWAAMRGEAPEPPDFAWRRRRIGRALVRADRALAPSAALAEVLRRVYRLPRPVGVIHNGRAPVAAVGEAPAGRFVLTAGRLWDEAKDVATLDRAAPEIAAPVLAAGPLAGPNGEAAALRNATPVGVLDPAAMAAHHAAASVFVSTARYEPFGLAVLEAAQAGRPLVLSDIPTFRELWEGAAVFFPPGASAGLAQAVNRLLADPARAARLGDQARARATAYGVGAMVAGYLREYRALLAAPARLAG